MLLQDVLTGPASSESGSSPTPNLRSKVIAKPSLWRGGWLRLQRASVAVLPMGTGEQQDSKKARVDPGPLLAGWKHTSVTIDKAKLECPVCTHALKPPVFKCAAGHLACGACHGQLADKDRCYRCAHPGGYSRDFPLEDVIRSTRAMCPYVFYGCFSSVVVYEVGDHLSKCPHAPCRCSEPGCAFVGSPTQVSDHLRVTHSWPVNSIDYGKKGCHLQLPESKPRCLLVAKEHGRVFVVSVAALRGVSLACLRANAAAGPHYTCKMWATGSAAAATGKVPAVCVEMEVPSSAVAGEAAATETDGEAALVVPRKMLHGPSMELHLNVRIDKVQT